MVFLLQDRCVLCGGGPAEGIPLWGAGPEGFLCTGDEKTLVFPGDPLWRVFGSGDSGAPGFSHHTRRQQTGGPEGGRDPDGDAAGCCHPVVSAYAADRRAAVCGGAAGGLVCRQAHTGVCPGAGYPVRHRLFLSGNGYSRGGSPVGAGGAQSVYCFGQERQRLLVHAVRVSALPAGEAAAAGKAAGAGGSAGGESGPVAAESGPGFQLL